MEESPREVVPPKEPDLTGRQVGEFRLLRRLGQGAMAEVYLAEQVSLKRQVAIKVLKGSLAANDVYVRRFRREAQAAAALVHANIVQIHGVGQIDRLHYIVQEYVQGVNLRQWLARNGPPDLRMALLIMRQVAAALSKAAEQGIVHRDIKPENIMLTRSGEVKVADFGLARLLEEGQRLELTEVGVTLGTPLYMSPEQVEGKALDPRSDIYSFGVTCYQMLAGCPPFSGETALSVALQHVKKQPDPLENHRRDLPAPLCRAVHKMLSKSPEGRFQSARELLRELHRIQVAHLGEEWPEDAPTWDTAMAPTVGITLNETTERLSAVMKAARITTAPRPRWLIWLAAGAISFLLGGGVGLLVTGEEWLLADVQEHPPFPRQDSAFRQWLYASQVGTQEAWASIQQYYPDKQYWVNRANQRLAQLLLFEGELDAAMDRFEDLASQTEPEFRAFGLAGQCFILTKQGKYRESNAIMAQLTPIRDKLTDPAMSQMLNYADRTNRSRLKVPDEELQKWLDEQTRSGELTPQGPSAKK
jgi:serine/threonine-protein kinase